jgi:hypothetical protein
MQYIWNNNPQLAFAQHILNICHEYGKIDEFMTAEDHKTQTIAYPIRTVLHTSLPQTK